VSYNQWGRVVEVTISGKAGTLKVDKLKIDFSISKGIGSSQNEAKISVWNLTKSHRKQLGEEFDRIELRVGYRDGPIFTIFKGNIRDAKTTRESADVKSEMECGDGDEGIGKGAVSKTFPAGTKPKEIIDHIIGEMPGTTKGEMKGIDDLPAYKRPVSVYGWASRELDKLGREHAFYWSVQGGEVQAVKNDQVLSGTTVVSKETGMLDTPEVTDKGVKFKALIRPGFEPGRQVDVRSDFLDEESGKDKRQSDEGGGLFRVSQVTLNGTNRGQEFYGRGRSQPRRRRKGDSLMAGYNGTSNAKNGTDALRGMIEAERREINTVLDGTIVSYDRASQQATIQPKLKRKFGDQGTGGRRSCRRSRSCRRRAAATACMSTLAPGDPRHHPLPANATPIPARPKAVMPMARPAA